MSKGSAFKNIQAINEILDVKKEYLACARSLSQNLGSGMSLLDGEMAVVDALEMGFAIELISYARQQEAAQTLSGLAERFNEMSRMCGMEGSGAKRKLESDYYARLSKKLGGIAAALG